MIRFVARLLGFILLVFVVPLATHAAWWWSHPHPATWSQADWSSAGILEPAASHDAAVVHVLAGRTGRWKGIFAHHTWIVTKSRGADRYRRHEVVGWGRPLRVDAYAPDGRWYSDTPRILLTLSGVEAEQAIPRIERAIAQYPFAGRGSYAVWPGPNSNTFIAYVARAVPELAPGLLPTAIGKDFATRALYAGPTPSGTGYQLTWRGLLGVSLGWVEGLEINMLGLVAGIDVRRPALKLPGWGRLGVPA